MEKHEIPEAIKEAMEIFDKMEMKISKLYSNLNIIERDDAITDLIEFNQIIKSAFMKEWYTVLAQDFIIEKLEYYLGVLGHNVDPIRFKIMEDEDIVELLKKGGR